MTKTETATETLIWDRCPHCFAATGQPCRTRHGINTKRIHNGRSCTVTHNA